MIRNATLCSVLCFLISFSAFGQSSIAEPSAATYKKARSIIVDEVNFNETLFSDAIGILKKKSESADPDKQGLNFIIKQGPDKQDPFVTISLKKVPLSEVLKYIAAMSNYQLQFEEQAIVLTAPVTVKKTAP